MGLREIKNEARRDLHDEMKVPASYYSNPATYVGTIYVRVHTKWTEQGDLKGTNLNYAETEDTVPRVLFDRSEVANPPRNGYVVISSEEGYRIGQTEPPDGITITAEVAPMTVAELAGKILPPGVI
jgi:hypothetical protein